ncbi:unnamed protein product [Microthlaspi erraticum]|uniref:Retrotransposon gag domain-containing protein n=1 Tax=Microthlaspi erraticum TaxID=1685480 RepID=A0A6D2HZM7_9BRAS|nr:unnamed protein product [Microthlaspi erraticum]
MGRKEHGRTWHGRSSTGYAKEEGEAILKTSSTIYSTNRSSSSTRPAKLQLDRAEKSKSNPKNAILHMEVMEIAGKSTKSSNNSCSRNGGQGVGWISLGNDPMASKVYANSIETVYKGLGRARLYNGSKQRQGIVPPPVQNNNFEIKLGMINLVQNKMFHGLPSEDPIDHLDEFDRLCDLTKINGVSKDAIKLRLFPMSLADKAHQWEKSLPHGTITTWDECKKAFLAKFFSTGRTAKLRSEISSFIQRNNETFAEAWERFKSYTSQCPHHGFNNKSLLSTLYRGCLARYREMLDTASNGNFRNQDVDDGWQLVENIAISTECYGENYESTDWSSTAHSIELEAQMRKDMLALNSKLDKQILAQFPAKHVNSVSGKALVKDQEGEENQHEVCYIQNRQGRFRNPQQGYTIGYGQQGTYSSYPNTLPQQHLSVPPSFTQWPNHTQPSQDWDMKDMLKQLLQGQAKGSLEMNHKLLDRVEAWPVELRNSTGWSSRRSSWSSRWLLPSSFAYPVELLPCAKSLHAPCPICSRMLQKTYFKGPNMHIVPQRTGRLGRGLEMGDGHQERSTRLGSAHSIELALDSIELCLELATLLPKTCSCETQPRKS